MFLIAKVSILHLTTDDTQFGRICDTLQDEFRAAGIRVAARLSWDTPYHHGYSDNPFHQIVLDTYKDTRSKFATKLKSINS
jgi:hypothetical protein